MFLETTYLSDYRKIPETQVIEDIANSKIKINTAISSINTEVINFHFV